MSEELKPCPFCGGNNVSVYTNEHENRKLKFTAHVSCYDCHIGSGSGFHETPKMATDEAYNGWNLRTPEKGTSVIRWTRYDGIVYTLPNEGKDVIVYLPRYGISKSTIRTGGVWGILHGKPDYVLYPVAIGDMWAYLPTPEGV